MNTLEEKIEEKNMKRELKELLPNYGEFKNIKDGNRSWKCRLFGHRRIVHHQFFVEETERGKEYFECHVCVRCKDIEGKLVRIEKIEVKMSKEVRLDSVSFNGKTYKNDSFWISHYTQRQFQIKYFINVNDTIYVHLESLDGSLKIGMYFSDMLKCHDEIK